MPSTEELAIVEQAIAGHSAAQCELARIAFPRVFACCLSRVHHRQDAEELAQESLLRAILNLKSLEHPQRWLAWVRSIAVHVCLDWQRQQRFHRSLDQSFFDSGDEGSRPEDLLLVQEERRLVQESLTSLPEDLREVTILHYFESLTYEQIAEWLGVARATVSERLSRARQLLRVRLSSIGSSKS